MSLRSYIQTLNQHRNLDTIEAPISTEYEIAGALKALEPRPALFTNVSGSPYRLVGGLFPSKQSVADYLGLSVSELIPALAGAIEHCSRPEIISGNAPCQEVVELEPDLDTLPILRHCAGDGGRYISAGIVVARHPQYGQNVDFHRAMQIGRRELALRVVEGRHFDRFLGELGQVEIALCVGNAPNVLLAAATSVELGVDEFEIANTLEPLRLVKARTVNVYVPAEAEFVLEGVVHRDRRQAEGPFVDLTGTYDVVREQPVFEVRAITHRRDAIWQALLPGGLEHKLLMGMPREPTIFRAVNQVVACRDVHINPGGCSWLHAIVQIEKQHPEDGKRAIEAAFAGHRSCKHVFVVDGDIDIYDPLQVEWALATRFQGDRDLVLLPPERGSSLDPSAAPGSHLTTKMGFDLTKPLGEAARGYERAEFPSVDLTGLLEG